MWQALAALGALFLGLAVYGSVRYLRAARGAERVNAYLDMVDWNSTGDIVE